MMRGSWPVLLVLAAAAARSLAAGSAETLRVLRAEDEGSLRAEGEPVPGAVARAFAGASTALQHASEMAERSAAARFASAGIADTGAGAGSATLPATLPATLERLDDAAQLLRSACSDPDSARWLLDVRTALQCALELGGYEYNAVLSLQAAFGGESRYLRFFLGAGNCPPPSPFRSPAPDSWWTSPSLINAVLPMPLPHAAMTAAQLELLDRKREALAGTRAGTADHTIAADGAAASQKIIGSVWPIIEGVRTVLEFGICMLEAQTSQRSITAPTLSVALFRASQPPADLAHAGADESAASLASPGISVDSIAGMLLPQWFSADDNRVDLRAASEAYCSAWVRALPKSNGIAAVATGMTALTEILDSFSALIALPDFSGIRLAYGTLMADSVCDTPEPNGMPVPCSEPTLANIMRTFVSEMWPVVHRWVTTYDTWKMTNLQSACLADELKPPGKGKKVDANLGVQPPQPAHDLVFAVHVALLGIDSACDLAAVAYDESGATHALSAARKPPQLNAPPTGKAAPPPTTLAVSPQLAALQRLGYAAVVTVSDALSAQLSPAAQQRLAQVDIIPEFVALVTTTRQRLATVLFDLYVHYDEQGQVAPGDVGQKMPGGFFTTLFRSKDTFQQILQREKKKEVVNYPLPSVRGKSVFVDTQLALASSRDNSREHLASSLSHLAKFVMLVSAASDAIGKGDLPPPPPPFELLSGARLLYGGATAASAFELSRVLVESYSETNLLWGWTARELDIDASGIAFSAPTSTGGRAAAAVGGFLRRAPDRRLLSYSGLDALMLPAPAPHINVLAADKGLAAAAAKARQGHLCGVVAAGDAKKRAKAHADDLHGLWARDSLAAGLTAASAGVARVALRLPDPAPTTRYWPFCTRTAAPPAGANNAAVTAWLADARNIIVSFCAAAHATGLSTRLLLEQRWRKAVLAATPLAPPAGLQRLYPQGDIAGVFALTASAANLLPLDLGAELDCGTLLQNPPNGIHVTRLPDSKPLDAATPYNVRATMPVKRTLAVLEAAANAYLPLFHDMQAEQWNRFVHIGRQPAAEAKHVADNIDAIKRPPFNARVFASTHAKMASNQKLEMRVSPSTFAALHLAHKATFIRNDEEPADTDFGGLKFKSELSSDYAKIWVDDTSRLIVVGFKALVTGENEQHSTLDALAGSAGILYSRMKGTQRYREAVAAVALALKEKPSYAMVAVGWCMGGHLAMEISDVFGIPAIVFNPAPRIKIFWQATLGGLAKGLVSAANAASLGFLRPVFNFVTHPLRGIRYLDWLDVVSPRSAGAGEDELLLYMSSRKPQLGNGRIQVHAVAGDLKPASYFTAGKPMGYDLFLYPSLASRTQTGAHYPEWIGLLPIERDAAKRAAAALTVPTLPAGKSSVRDLGPAETEALYRFYTMVTTKVPLLSGWKPEEGPWAVKIKRGDSMADLLAAMPSPPPKPLNLKKAVKDWILT